MRMGKGMLSTTIETTKGAGNMLGKTGNMLGKGMLTTTIETTKGAGNIFVDAAQKTNKSIASLVHDAAALALLGEEADAKDEQPIPLPLYVPSSWEKKDNPHVISQSAVSCEGYY